MASQVVKIWYDKEGDFLEILFSDKAGYMRSSADEGIMERVDEEGKVIGISFMEVSKSAADHPLYKEFVLRAA